MTFTLAALCRYVIQHTYMPLYMLCEVDSHACILLCTLEWSGIAVQSACLLGVLADLIPSHSGSNAQPNLMVRSDPQLALLQLCRHLWGTLQTPGKRSVVEI